MAKKVLLAGESWSSHTTHVKGFDTFFTSVYEEGGKWLIAALEKSGKLTVSGLRWELEPKPQE